MIQISLTPEGDRAVCRLSSFLGGTAFQKYRDACYHNGFRATKEPSGTWINIGPVAQVIALCDAFSGAELAFQIDERITSEIKDQAENARRLLSEGRARVEAAKARLEGSGLAPYRFQETGVEWLAPRDRAMLIDEMGLGKTVQALLALGDRPAALVVLPAGVRCSWENECRRWRPDLRPVVLAGRATFRWPEPGEVLLATYGILPESEEAIPGAPPVGMYLLADEAHALKNPKAKRTKACKTMAEMVRAYKGRTWGITGTPLLNRPPELATLFKVFGVFEESFGNWLAFVRLFDGRKGSHGYEWGRPAEDVPEAIRRVALHRRRADVLKDLPGKRRSDLEVNGLDAGTVALCDEFLALLKARGIDLGQMLSDVQATKISGPIFEMMSKVRAALATAKIPALLEIVAEYEEAETPLVVFSCHLPPVEALAKRPGWATITGGTSSDERGRIIDAFQAGRLKGIAGTVGAMGVGVTLTHAAHMLFVDLAWTPALNCQAEDRICRIGQKAAGCIITRLVARHALDARVAELLRIKQEIIEASVEASAVEGDWIGPSPQEVLAEGAERLAGKIADLEGQAETAAKKEAEERAEKYRARIAEIVHLHDGREVEFRGKVRTPANAREEHAARAMLLLAGLDTDFAAVRNDMGFSKFDGELGHSLACQIRDSGMLTEKQWVVAVRLATRYRRQVGPMPPAGEPCLAVANDNHGEGN